MFLLLCPDLYWRFNDWELVMTCLGLCNFLSMNWSPLKMAKFWTGHPWKWLSSELVITENGWVLNWSPLKMAKFWTGHPWKWLCSELVWDLGLRKIEDMTSFMKKKIWLSFFCHCALYLNSDTLPIYWGDQFHTLTFFHTLIFLRWPVKKTTL